MPRNLLFQINFMIKKKSHISHTTYEIRNLKNNITGVRKAKPVARRRKRKKK